MQNSPTRSSASASKPMTILGNLAYSSLSKLTYFASSTQPDPYNRDMSITIEELVLASLIVLNARVNPTTASQTIRDLDTMASGRLTTVVDAVQGEVLSINAERINVKQQTNRVVMEMGHPQGAEGLVRLAEVAEVVTRNIDPISDQVESGRYTYGVNIDAICRQDSGGTANKYLAERFLNLGMLREQGYIPVDAAWRLQVESENTPNVRWSMNVDPFVGTTDTTSLFVKMNVHHENAVLPINKEDIAETFALTWKSIEAMINGMETPR